MQHDAVTRSQPELQRFLQQSPPETRTISFTIKCLRGVFGDPTGRHFATNDCIDFQRFSGTIAAPPDAKRASRCNKRGNKLMPRPIEAARLHKLKAFGSWYAECRANSVRTTAGIPFGSARHRRRPARHKGRRGRRQTACWPYSILEGQAPRPRSGRGDALSAGLRTLPIAGIQLCPSRRGRINPAHRRDPTPLRKPSASRGGR